MFETYQDTKCSLLALVNDELKDVGVGKIIQPLHHMMHNQAMRNDMLRVNVHVVNECYEAGDRSSVSTCHNGQPHEVRTKHMWLVAGVAEGAHSFGCH
jgi:hypothetical protein